MVRTLFFTSFLLCAFPACAGWERLAKSPRGDLYYLDTQINQKGTVHQVWSLVDLVEPIEKSASVKRLYEADCVKGKLRVVQKQVYAAKGGQGDLISSDNKHGKWIYPDPASVNEEMLLKICFGNTAGNSAANKDGQTESKKQGHKEAAHKTASH